MKDDSEAVGVIVGSGLVGIGTTITAISATGAVSGLSAAGMTSGLAVIGSVVGGGMAAGIVVAGAIPVTTAVSGYGLWKYFKNRKPSEE